MTTEGYPPDERESGAHVCDVCFPLQQALHQANLRVAALTVVLRRLVDPLEKCGAVEAARAVLADTGGAI